MIPNRNVLWGRVIAEELVRSGVTHVCVSPGSRSTPLALAFQAQSGLRLTTHVDERGAAFFALGVAKATGRPVALVCTSGTAAANYLPALVEATHARVPLVVFTADRPPELHGVGANQSIDQQRLYGVFTKWFVDLGVPQPTAARIRHLRTTICKAVAASLAAPLGPVHLNCPFQEPLEPTFVPGDVPGDWAKGDAEAESGRLGGAPFVAIAPTRVVPEPSVLDEFLDLLAASRRGIIIAGPREPGDDATPAILRLAEATGFPILADPLSQLRAGDVGAATILCAYDAWLADAGTRTSLRPDLVIRFGATPTSKNLLAWLQSLGDAKHALFDESGRFQDITQRADLIVPGAPGAVLPALLARARSQADLRWAADVVRHETAAQTLHANQLPARAFEGALVARLVAQLPGDATLFVSNSLPVRDLDRFGGRRTAPLPTYANRGASGIDGITSTALGVAHGSQQRVTLLTGDLAFLHDANGLAVAKRLGLALDVVLLNNDGGGIFEFLPIAQHDPPFTELFVTPHGIDLGKVAAAFGFQHERVTVEEALARPRLLPAKPGPNRVLEIVCDRKANVQQRRALEKLLAQRLEVRTHAD